MDADTGGTIPRGAVVSAVAAHARGDAWAAQNPGRDYRVLDANDRVISRRAAWAKSPVRRLIGECPTCDEILDFTLHVHFTHRDGQVLAEVRPEPVRHRCSAGPGGR